MAGEDEIGWAKSLFREARHREREPDASAGENQGKQEKKTERALKLLIEK